MFPKIRSGHTVVHLENGTSIIGSLTYGLGQSIDDPEGLLVGLNTILDGHLDLQQAVTRISELLDVSKDAARKFIDNLHANGHLEDALTESTLTDLDKIRYSRQAHYLSWINKSPEWNPWKPTERLKNCRVTILGVGGIGGVIASHLVGVGVGSVTLVDMDTVEVSNLNRQYLFTENSVGDPKVEEAAKRLALMNSECEIKISNLEISDSHQLDSLMSGIDLFFKAADYPPQMPYWVSDAALRNRIPWMDCSYAGPVINACTFVPGETGCYRCMKDSQANDLGDRLMANALSDEKPPVNAALGPVVHIAGSLAAYEAIRFLVGLNPQSVGRALHQNMYRYEHSYVIDIPETCSHHG